MKNMSILSRISEKEIAATARSIWAETSNADQIANESLKIINQSYRRQFNFFSGRSSKWLLGGLFYILGYRYSETRKQKELANKIGTTEMTIRDSYRSWLKTFPDLFVDVIGKMADDQSLKYFILIDLAKTRNYQVKI
jgi:transcription initiation factor TFIIIB Brf1 subunit/transcription initiation factor TFIIB